MTPPRVRRIRPDEGATLRAIRLRALADAPLAFGSTHAREDAYPPERWRDWAETSSAGGGSVFFFAVDEASGTRVGLASGAIRETDAETAHLYAMWVAPEARGGGAGGALVDAVVAWAEEHGALRVRTEVTVGNDGAARLSSAPASATRASAGRSATRTPRRRSSSGRSPADRGRSPADRGRSPADRGRYRTASAAWLFSCFLSPGQTPVKYRNPWAPRRSTAARVTRNVTPCTAAAAMTFGQAASSVVAFGGSSLSKIPQTALNTFWLRMPATIPKMMPNGL